MQQQQEEIKIDPVRLVAVEGAKVFDLSLTELRLLACFLLNKGKIVKRAELHANMQSAGEDRFSNIVDVYVNYLRQKIGKDKIRTVRGQGYVFGEVTA